MEVPIPKYFLIEKKKAIAEREKLLGLILSKLNQNVEEEVMLICLYTYIEIYKTLLTIILFCIKKNEKCL